MKIAFEQIGVKNVKMFFKIQKVFERENVINFGKLKEIFEIKKIDKNTRLNIFIVKSNDDTSILETLKKVQKFFQDESNKENEILYSFKSNLSLKNAKINY